MFQTRAARPGRWAHIPRHFPRGQGTPVVCWARCGIAPPLSRNPVIELGVCTEKLLDSITVCGILGRANNINISKNNTNTNMKYGYDEFVKLTRDEARLWVLWAERYLDVSPERNQFTTRFCGDPQKWLEILRHYADGGEVRTVSGGSTGSECGLAFRGPVDHYVVSGAEVRKFAEVPGPETARRERIRVADALEAARNEKAETSASEIPPFDGKLILQVCDYINAHGDEPVDLEQFDDVFAPHGVWLREVLLMFNRIRYTGEGEFVRVCGADLKKECGVTAELFRRMKNAESLADRNWNIAMQWKDRYMACGGCGRTGEPQRLANLEAIVDSARELCDALGERWFAAGDTEAQTARCVAAHMVLTDLLGEVEE